jgi:recombinational DNA repair ATPase RecF
MERKRPLLQERFNPQRYLDHLRARGFLYLIPFKIEKLNLENIHPVRKLTLRFGDKNILYGDDVSGRSAIPRLIANVFSRKSKKKQVMHISAKTGKIKLELVRDSKTIGIQLNKKKSESAVSAGIVIDGVLDILPSEFSEKLIDYLRELNMQVIITCYRLPRVNLKGFKIINLS